MIKSTLQSCVSVPPPIQYPFLWSVSLVVYLRTGECGPEGVDVIIHHPDPTRIGTRSPAFTTSLQAWVSRLPPTQSVVLVNAL